MSLEDLGSPEIHSRALPMVGGRMHRIRLALAMFAVALLAIAVGSRLSKDTVHDAASNPLNLFTIKWIPPFAERDITLSPALKAMIQQFVVETIEAHSMGRVHHWDFARRANGGRIALPVTSGNHGIFRDRANDPHFAIDHETHDDKCCVLPDLPSQLGLHLPLMICPSSVSITHPDIADVAQAPRNMTLWAVIEGKVNTHLYEGLDGSSEDDTHQQPVADALPIAGNLRWVPLVSFVYDIKAASTVQHFPIPSRYIHSGLSFGVYALVVHSNWGSPTTCLYNVGIYGVPAN
ncbi:hypothetical protein C8Q80DRAFT_1267483 [Daedaleopsis nitida]|nr:hypothetical protein C8Q80DRAFT_1267483 [Daedaleopsis nitida]